VLWALVSPGIQNQNTGTTDENINAILMQTSEALNRQLPEMVDDEKILEATAGFNKQFSYYFTLVDYSIDEIDIEAFRTQITPRHIEDVCSSETLQPFLREGVTISYVYADKDRREFTTISVHPADCN
jgi:hypothetical protein